MGTNDDDAGCGLVLRKGEKENALQVKDASRQESHTIKHKQNKFKIMTKSKEFIIFHLYVFSSSCSTTVVVYIRLNGLGLRALLFRAANGLSFARSFCAPTLVELCLYQQIYNFL